jgi:four helix bundle protein
MNEKRVFDLEERLIDFSVAIIRLASMLPNSPEGRYFRGQIVRSGSSTALNYGEAQAAESRKDFIHKSKIVLKELRETLVCLKIIKRVELLRDNSFLNDIAKPHFYIRYSAVRYSSFTLALIFYLETIILLTFRSILAAFFALPELPEAISAKRACAF